jgi:hypothetical protein
VISYTTESARGVRSYGDAMRMASDFSELFDTEYVVIYFGSERAYDVEPKHPADRLGTYNVVAIVSTDSIQELNPSVG